MKKLLTLCLLFFTLSASAQWQQTGSKVRYVNGLGIPTKDTAAGVLADSSQILIRPTDSSLYVKYKRTWVKVGGAGFTGSGTTNYLPKFTSSSAIGNSQIFDNGTFVGIGTASPASKLDVAGTSPSLYLTDNLSSPTEHGFQFYASGTGLRGGVTLNYNSAELKHWAGVSSNSYFQTFYTNGSERMRITSGGNVLINTTTDNGTDKLQVSGSINVSAKATVQNLSVTTNATIGNLISGNDINIVNTGSIPTLTSVQLTTQSFAALTTAKTTTYTTAYNDYFIDCTSGTFTVNLQDASSYTGRVLIIKNSGTGTITVDANGSQTIDGALTYSLSVQYATIQIISNGNNWKIISKF